LESNCQWSFPIRPRLFSLFTILPGFHFSDLQISLDIAIVGLLIFAQQHSDDKPFIATEPRNVEPSQDLFCNYLLTVKRPTSQVVSPVRMFSATAVLPEGYALFHKSVTKGRQIGVPIVMTEYNRLVANPPHCTNQHGGILLFVLQFLGELAPEVLRRHTQGCEVAVDFAFNRFSKGIIDDPT
jgi:hypothetical protein